MRKVSSLHHINKGQVSCSNALILAEERNKVISMEDFSLIAIDLTKHRVFPLIQDVLDRKNTQVNYNIAI